MKKSFCFYVFLLFIIFIILISILGRIVNLLFNKSILISIVFIIFCLLLILATIVYIIYINVKEIKIIENRFIKEYDNTKDYDYYRDKVDNYSPGLLMYLKNNDFDFNKVFVAILINLYNKKYINFNDNKIVIINNDWENLSKDEVYILESIKSNNLKYAFKDKKNRKYLKRLIKDELKKYYLIKNIITKKYDKFFNIVFSILFILLFTISLLNFIGNDHNNTFDFIFSLLLYGLSFVVGVISSNIYNYFKKNSYRRSEKAIEIAVKLECIKKYIIDFSILKDRNINEVELWDDYIIYTVMLDIDGNINRSINSVIKKYIVKDV